jgi:predicted deacetylase
MMTPQVAPAPPRRLLLSIHDVSPLHESEIDRLHDRLRENGGGQLAMLVVPNFWGIAPIVPGSPFASRLRRWAEAGVEMFLHGWLHRDDVRHPTLMARLKASQMTAREGEFLGLSAAEATLRIELGRALIEDVTGRPVAGFVAPAWLYGPSARAALGQARIGILEDHWKVWDAATGIVLARSPAITWATRTPARKASSLAVAAAARALPMPRVMRLAVHPGDTSSDAVLRSITATVTALCRNHVVSRYADLVGDAECAS